MPVIILMLRGVNVGGHNVFKMDALRTLYESLGFRNVESYVQSGNVVFSSEAQSLAALAKQIGDGIEKRFGFRPDLILRTPSDLKSVIARNPFARRQDLDPRKLHVMFLADNPQKEALQQIAELKTDPEELRISGRELYMYFHNGMGRSGLSLNKIEKILSTPGTARNWNTVEKLLEMARRLEATP
jgi:uncharacterized protein (DUF1697 family)